MVEIDVSVDGITKLLFQHGFMRSLGILGI
jgi:hypothetical protein